ncbi:MAG: hypothetical protein M3O68_04835 [Thermoproteota archaeon]|nr:hypothetical protein [Thermoproteota archaeon]
MLILDWITLCLRKNAQKLQSIVIASALLTSVLTFLHPIELLAQDQVSIPSSPSPSPSPSSSTIPPSRALVNCSLATPFIDPVDMNTVIFKDIAKTIHVEKEAFRCKTKSGALVIALVSLYTELFTNMKTLLPSNKTVESDTCVKGYNGTVLWCHSSHQEEGIEGIGHGYPLTTACDPISLRTQPVPSPIEMETVVGTNGIVQTLEAEKEIFLCDFKQNKPTTLLGVTLFTEIFEDILGRYPVLIKTFESVSCLTDIGSARVLKCSFGSYDGANYEEYSDLLGRK